MGPRPASSSRRGKSPRVLLCPPVVTACFIPFCLLLLTLFFPRSVAGHDPARTVETPAHPPERGREADVRIGVLANRGKEMCLVEWGPTADYLTAQLSPRRFRIVPLDFSDVESAVVNGEVHFVLLNPSMYVNLESQGLAYRIATFQHAPPDGEGPLPVFGGVAISRSDRQDLQTLADTKGKRFAAVSLNSMGGWHTVARELMVLGIRPERDFADLSFLGTHDEVVGAVRSGRADAGSVRSTQIERMILEGKARPGEFKVLAGPFPPPPDYPFLLSTRLYPEWPFAAVRGTDLELGKAVASALLRMAPGDVAAKAAQGAGWAVPLDYASVHDCLRDLRLPPYENEGRVGIADAVSQYWPALLSILVAMLVVAGLATMAWRTSSRLGESVMALEESERKYRGVVENIQDVFYRVDAEGRVRLLSASAARILGYDSVADLIGESADIFWADPRERGKLIDALARHGYVRDYEFEALRRDGSRLLASATVRVLRDDSGAPCGYEGIWRDITEKKQAERALLESEKRFHSLFTNMAEGVVMHELVLDEWGSPVDYLLVDCNSRFEELMGRSREELVGKAATELYGTPDAPYIREYAGVALSGVASHLAVHFSPLGRDFEISVAPWGESGFAAIFSDVTQRKLAEQERTRLEEDLVQVRKLESIGQLAGGVAHDLNNMLAPILGYTEMLLLDLPAESRGRKELRQVFEAASRARDLTRQLLAFARKQTLAMKPVDLNRILGGLSGLLRRTIRENIVIETRLCPDLGLIEADAGQIEQIVLNLAANAQDAMPEGGTLVIETCNVIESSDCVGGREGAGSGPRVMVSVSDTGMGMDGETQERIFDPFFTTKELGRGTGLGLSTVYGIVKQHGGCIQVESSPGEGTVFLVSFPQSCAIPEPREPVFRNARVKGAETVLVVEDQDEVRAMVREMLRLHGYAVLSARDGESALLLAESHDGPMDLLVTDVVMTGIDGNELYRRLRVIRPGIGVLFMSGYPADVIGQHGVLRGGVHFVQKPFVLSDFMAKVREALGTA